MSEWLIGLSAWIIQDGNYGDFARNERAAFALEFYPHNLRPSSLSEVQVTHAGAGRYKVNARVIAVFEHAWVIDFGVRAFQQADPSRTIRTGSWIDAEIDLGIDPFFYFEDLSQAEEMPALIYDWVIHKITIQTAPFLETRDAHGRLTLVRDKSKSDYREIERTDAWKDDNGFGDYLLRCALTNPHPRKTQTVLPDQT